MTAELFALSPIQSYLEDLREELQGLDAGEVASYIPELLRADPNGFGIALATVDGHVYQAGDTRQPFTIQSISKAVTYGQALEDRGVAAVLAKVGVEPSGEAFNSISLEPDTGRPLNPMINAGAIATTGMISGGDYMGRILEGFERYTGHALEIDQSVYRSESETGHRNRAIAELLYGYGILERPAAEVVDLYFRQCSILVTARDLAMIGACLANNGVNPVTGMVALRKESVPKVLSVMSSCGMYDYSGAWVYEVGMPAKSGVGGGIVAVLPGQLGLGVFSPPLDAKGNSVRGIEVCRRISGDHHLHLFSTVRATSASVLRVRYDGAQIRSHRWRSEQEVELLQQCGGLIQIYELQGELKFGSAESLVQDMLTRLDGFEFLIIEVSRVVEIGLSAYEVLFRLGGILAARGKTLLFTGTTNHYPFRKQIKKRFGTDADALFRFDEVDRALEWCESRLLQRRSEERLARGRAPDLCDQYLCRGLEDAETAQLRQAGRPVEFRAGERIFAAGDPAGSFFFVVEGEVDIVVATDSLRKIRLATLTPGMSFGELSLVSDGGRSADAVAAADCRCIELRFDDLDDRLKNRLLVNLAAHLSRKLQKDAMEMRRLG